LEVTWKNARPSKWMCVVAKGGDQEVTATNVMPAKTIGMLF
jgi:hypothetical protein